MEKTYVLTSPIKIQYGRDKKGKAKVFSLNLNQYRNTNWFILNKVKQLYGEIMSEPVKQLPSFNKIEIRYVLFLGSKRLTDVSNVCSIVDKFFCDVLTTHGKIIDDNHTILPKVSYEFGGIDSSNPRVEIHIKELNNGS